MGHHHHHHECECPPVVLPCPGVFGLGGVGFWVFLLILALLGISWAEGGLGPTPA